MTSIELLGSEKLIRIFSKSTSARIVDAVAQATYEEALIAFNKSQRLVPVDKSPLKQSGTIFPPLVIGTRITVELGYGGSASAYAMRQHEDMTYKHKGGKTAKYLENPVRERIPNYEAHLSNRVRRILGK